MAFSIALLILAAISGHMFVRSIEITNNGLPGDASVSFDPVMLVAAVLSVSAYYAYLIAS